MTFEHTLDLLYAAAVPYWQVRDNQIHVPEAFQLAKELLTHYPAADREVVLPAILLHDVGYAAVPSETHYRGLPDAPIGWSPEITRHHEIEGTRIAGELLGALGFDREKTKLVQEIVDGHDSRTEAISLEDAIVKDADKLWRFTPNGVRLASGWMRQSWSSYIDHIEVRIPRWMLTDHGARMARQLVSGTRELLLPEQVNRS